MEATSDDLMHEPPAERPPLTWWETDLLLLGTFAGAGTAILGHDSPWFLLLDSAGILGSAGFLTAIFTRKIRELRRRE